jgi:hypothetical protein
VTRRRKSQPKSADRGADAQPSARCRMTAKESFDLADVIGASRLRELERDPFPARHFFAQLPPGVHITSVWHPTHSKTRYRVGFIPFADTHLPHHPLACWARGQMNN